MNLILLENAEVQQKMKCFNIQMINSIL